MGVLASIGKKLFVKIVLFDRHTDEKGGLRACLLQNVSIQRPLERQKMPFLQSRI